MRRCAGLWLVAVLAVAVARPAGAFEFLNGAIQVHGYGETIIRLLNSNFNSSYDLSQMQFVLDLETEYDIAPDGIGPFSSVTAFTRFEVRYDCIWTRACKLSQTVDQWGDRVAKLPKERTNGRNLGDTVAGTALANPLFGTDGERYQHDQRVTTVRDSLFATAFENKGPDQILGTKDDPAPLILGKFANYKLTTRAVPGSIWGHGTDIQMPLRPDDKILTENGAFRFYPNATSPLEADRSCSRSTAAPAAGCAFGYEIAGHRLASGRVDNAGPSDSVLFSANPGDRIFNPAALKAFRPYPTYSVKEAAAMGIPKTEASGLYAPSPGLRKFLMNNQLSNFDQNYSQNRLAWDLGASQEDEWFLREAYFDLEMLDGRLWFRIGKQTIVWGKTEIFRSQDQFNPQDVGLATLPSLEESRIALWALRMTYSFYDVGPLQDVRLELAALLDQFEPADLGRCGEPYVPNPVYGKCLGIFGHSAVGLGVAGEVRSKPWYETTRGLEGGARLEWRWRRFSFALTDYYGFNDFPTAQSIFTYSRNVDPMTGRPRFGMSDLPCDPQHGQSHGCLGFQSSEPYPEKEMLAAGFNPVGVGGNCQLGFIGGGACFGRGSHVGAKDEVQNTRILNMRNRNLQNDARKRILENQSANQTFFNFACAASVGFTAIIPDLVTECGFNIFGSNKIIETGFPAPFDRVPVVAGISMILGGSSTLYDAAIGFLSPQAAGLLTVVPLNHNDLGPAICPSGPGCTKEWTPKGRTGEGFGQLWGDFSLNPAVGDTKPGNATNFLFALVGSVSSALTPEQQALLGCGAYYASSCDRQGMDLLNAEASALFQSWPGFDGTPNFHYQMTDKNKPAPGTVHFRGGPVCTRYERGKTFMLPGCRGPGDPGYNPRVDGVPYFNEMLNNNDIGPVIPGINGTSDLVNFNDFATKNGCPSILKPGVGGLRLKSGNIRLFNPLNCQPFRSEMAALSFNFLALAILFSGDKNNDGFSKPQDYTEFDPSRPYTAGRCSLTTPQYCDVVRSLLGATGVGRNTVKAGGNWDFGRRDFTWHGGQELALVYDRRNVLGFSSDFSEDWSKTNWGVEFTWINKYRFSDRNSPTGLTTGQVFNLTVSVDRPTFINFLSVNRTFLFNSQWFMSYTPNYSTGFDTNGPFNVLATFTALTGYFQDRLSTALTIVYDFQSVSGAGLPSIRYQFNEAFSVEFGLAFFYGQYQTRDPYLSAFAPASRVGPNAYTDYVENGLAVVRDRDEAYFRVRYTF